MNKNLTHEEKLMALISHLSVIIPNIGIIVPIIIWLTQKEKSNFTRFNSLQAIFFQLFFLLIMMICIFVGIILMIISMMPLIGNPSSEPGSLFFVSMIFMFLYFPIWFIFSVYALIGSILSYKGKNFKYIVIGRIIENKVYR